MKVENMKSPRTGRSVPNQFVITDDKPGQPFITYFQSYGTMIVKVISGTDIRRQVWLDKDHWDYSCTTSKYRNQFLGETTKETKTKIKSGEYVLADLN